LRILNEIGIKVPGEDARAIYRKIGCSYNDINQTITINSNIVEKALRGSIKSFILAGRDPSKDIKIKKGYISFSTGGGSPNYLDHGTKNVRKATLEDVAHTSHLINNLPYIDICHRSLEPSDVEKDIVNINKYFAWANNNTKHVVLSISSLEGLRKVKRCAEIIAGSKRELRERPILSIVSSWVISPLVYHPESTSVIIEAIKNRIPVEFSSCPMTMTTSPATLSGTLAQFLAEILGGKVLAFGINPESPVLLGGAPSISDPHSFAFTPGAPEFGLLNAAAAQIGRVLDFPTVVSAAYSDDNMQSAQAGYESSLTSLLTALTGTDILHGFDMFSSGLAVSAESTVIANEVIGMIKRIIRGIEVNTEKIGFETIKEVGPGKGFFMTEHTLKNFKDELFFPSISNKKPRDLWLKEDGLDTNDRAWNLVQEIMQKKPDNLDKAVLTKIKQEFPEIVNELF
ncbi:MAG: trimethylamine methyltransferase family protein, partial [Nitrososphaeraceae archaeon]|nr:trimethylamine methyltransferase family protein [Nitrososphaeraceae archaeon]